MTAFALFLLPAGFASCSCCLSVIIPLWGVVEQSIKTPSKSTVIGQRQRGKMLFSELTDDIVLKILWKVEDDPRDWGRLSCVSTRFRSLIRDFCWKNKCALTIPSELLSASDPFSLHKLSFCCPGPLHAGLLFDSDEEQHYPLTTPPPQPQAQAQAQAQSQAHDDYSYWSLYDDLYHDTLYAATESQQQEQVQPPHSPENEIRHGVVVAPCASKRRKVCGSWSSHLASGKWNLSREQGSKLLARQFRDDCLYVCDWPGCVHSEEKREYRLFRGVFKNFKRTRVWRTVNDGNRRKLDLPCAFCNCKHTWDLHSAFCLRRGFGFHDDGEPVVRAYVCDNGHVSGAWTDVPMYT